MYDCSDQRCLPTLEISVPPMSLKLMLCIFAQIKHIPTLNIICTANAVCSDQTYTDISLSVLLPPAAAVAAAAAR